MGNTSGVKKVVLVRRDLRLRRAEVASLVSKATARFFLDNDESEERDKIEVKLSEVEMDWMSTGMNVVVLGVASSNAMESILWRCEAAGISTYTVSVKRMNEEDKAESYEDQVACAVLGPDYSDSIDQITGKLKLF